MGKNKLAKANGLKSTFKINDDKYIMTTFDKGYYSKKEKGIKKESKEIIDYENNFTARFLNSDNQIEIDGNIGKPVNILLPCDITNQLGAKETIEKMFFKNAPENGFNDNIHIQVAYKIMNIKKLFTVYTNNMIYSVNNLLKIDCDSDLVGTFYTGNNFKKAKFAYDMNKTNLLSDLRRNLFIVSDVWNKEKNSKLKELYDAFTEYDKTHFSNSDYFSRLKTYIKNELGFSNYKDIENTAISYNTIAKSNLDRAANYFSDIFADKDGNVNFLYVFESIRLLSMIRQSSYHSFEFKNKHMCTIFELDDKIKKGCNDYIDTKTALNEIFDNKVNSINTNFVNTNKVNINIIFDIYNNRNKQQLVKNYYDFLIRKVYKNIGFSITTLREAIIEHHYSKASSFDLTNKQYDSYRSKIYALMDFVIYNFYNDNPDKIDEFVQDLRSLTTKNEDEKLKIYKKHAQSVYDNLFKHFNKIIEELNNFKNNPKDERFTKNIEVNDIDIQSPNNFTMFSKAMYCITSFLDGKEINMFLDSMINSIENIDSFFDFAKDIEMDMELVDAYKMFENSKQIANELKFIKSIARMNKSKKATKDSKVNIKSYQYYDSAFLFGQTDIDKIQADFKLNQKFEDGKKTDHTLRNFFINNVINSNRFFYVIRFIKPEDGRKIMHNKNIVSFAINEINDTQIIRYCKTTNIKFNYKNPDYTQMRKRLADKLTNVNYDTFSNISNDPKKNVEKEQLKALAGLYLTILYLIVKSLVRINVSYSIAFSTAERDFEIISKKIPYSTNDCKFKTNPIYLTKMFNDDNKLNSKVKFLIKENNKHFDKKIFREFRNSVEHLNAISSFAKYADDITEVKSYFDLYHILLANSVKDKLVNAKNYPQFIKDADNINKHQTAGKDYLYGILSPLAYNTSRYMNLACRYRFNKSFGK